MKREMTLITSVVATLLAACAGQSPVHNTTAIAGGAGDGSICAGVPHWTSGWRHPWKSPAIALGEARHRGVDLVTSADAPNQKIRGEVSYGELDKALEDEWVDVYACKASEWQTLGSVVTDGEGHFELDLTGDLRLGGGLTSLYFSVAGDGTGVEFLALVLSTGSKLVVSDVDGTLTSSENAFPSSLLTHGPVLAHEGAPQAITELVKLGYHPVYLTARGRVFTETTREWLASQGFPLGPVRLAPTLVTLPGQATIDYKAGTMSEFIAARLEVGVGIGNRASDVAAYTDVGVDAKQIFIKLYEFESEVSPALAGGEAVGFASYVDVQSIFAGLPPAE